MEARCSNSTRRDFIRELGKGAIALAAGDLLTGCGQGGGGSLSSSYNTTGSVNMSQIGGTNLSVLSTYQTNSTVNTQGQFTTTASAQRSQLLGVTDGTGKLRALSISVPPGQQAGSVRFDANSTALGLVMLTPGILTLDPTVTTQRMQQLASLASFATLSSYLAQNLPTQSLNDLQQDANLDQLKTACISDWNTQFSGRSINIQNRRAPGDPSFSVQFTPGQAIAVSLINSGWRFLSIVREDLDANGNSLRVTPLKFTNGFAGQALGLFDGESTVNWSSLFSGTVGTPAHDTDTTEPGSLTNIPGIATLKYWFYGPGNYLLNDTSDQPSTTVTGSFNVASSLGASVVYYVLFPVLDLATGGLSILVEGIKTPLGQASFAAQAVWSSIQRSINMSPLIQAIAGGNTNAIIAALVDVLSAMIGFADAIVSALQETGLDVAGAGSLGAIAKFLTATAVAFSIANLSVVGVLWAGQYPTVANVKVGVSGAGVTIQ